MSEAHERERERVGEREGEIQRRETYVGNTRLYLSFVRPFRHFVPPTHFHYPLKCFPKLSHLKVWTHPSLKPVPPVVFPYSTDSCSGRVRIHFQKLSTFYAPKVTNYRFPYIQHIIIQRTKFKSRRCCWRFTSD